jgi:hypothetical protein
VADQFLKLNLKNMSTGTIRPEDFESADTSHDCDPTASGCMTFKDGMKVKVRRDKQGNLVLKVTPGK